MQNLVVIGRVHFKPEQCKFWSNQISLVGRAPGLKLTTWWWVTQTGTATIGTGMGLAFLYFPYFPELCIIIFIIGRCHHSHQIWMRLNRSKRCKIDKTCISNREINKLSFSNPLPVPRRLQQEWTYQKQYIRNDQFYNTFVMSTFYHYEYSIQKWMKGCNCSRHVPAQI